MDKEKEVNQLVKYINDCIQSNKVPVLSKREIKLLQDNKDMIQDKEDIIYLI